jgi:hypothetical protein
VASPRRADHAASTSSRVSIVMDVAEPTTTESAEAAAAAWSLRVRRIGGLIQTAFAGFWLVRGSVVLGGAVSGLLVALFGVAVIGAFGYAVRVTAGMAPRPRSPEGRRIERAVTVATVIELVAAFVLPVIVSAAGHSDWVLPSIAITIGPLLLYLDHLVQIPRYRPVGWALTIGPVVLVAILSGTALVATTGITAGLLLLGTAVAGFHDLAAVRREGEQAGAAGLAVSTSAQAPL